MRTPAHYLGFWDSKLASNEDQQSLAKVDFIDRPKSNKTAQEVTISEIQQIGFDF
jgi:hypothetical protein